MAGKRKTQPRRKDRAGRGHDFADVAALNDRQRLFVAYYVESLNGTDSATRAGYAAKGAAQTASVLLRNPKVREAVEAGLKGRAMGPDEIRARLSAIARIDFTGFTDENGLLDLKAARERGLMRFVKKLKIGKDGISLEIMDVQGALVKLGEGHRLWGKDDPKDGENKPATLAEYLAKIDERERARAAAATTATPPPAPAETVH